MDNDCESYCCDKPGDDREGSCVAFEENQECIERGDREEVILETMLALTFFSVIICSIMKVLENEGKKKEIRAIHEKAALRDVGTWKDLEQITDNIGVENRENTNTYNISIKEGNGVAASSDSMINETEDF